MNINAFTWRLWGGSNMSKVFFLTVSLHTVELFKISLRFCPSSSVWSQVVSGSQRHTTSLQDCGRLACPPGQLALAGQPAVRWRADVRRCPGRQLLGGYSCPLFCWVSVNVWHCNYSFRLLHFFLPPWRASHFMSWPLQQPQWELLDSRSGGVWHH